MSRLRALASGLDHRAVILALFLCAVQPQYLVADDATGDPGAGYAKSRACVSCHGLWGQGGGRDNAVLAGQHAEYLEAALRQYRDGARADPDMAAYSRGLSDQDIRDISAYYAAQPE